jgi:hypothetical protein
MTGTRRVRGSAEVIRSLFYLGDGFLKTSAILALAPARNRMLEGTIPHGREKSTNRGADQQGNVWDECTLSGMRYSGDLV